MRICAAQTRPVIGNIQKNIDSHLKLIDLAISNRADIIIFPELSLTGYEPAMAKELAIEQNDKRLNVLQKISDERLITIGVGVPVRNNSGTSISMILFQPDKPRQTYSKHYLHSDEDEFFVSGENLTDLNVNQTHIALAICYEISVDEHTAKAFDHGAGIYIASVAKFTNGIDKALDRLSAIAEKYSATVLMSNGVGRSDGNDCAGKTSVWNSRGLLGQLDGKSEGILIIDTETHELTKALIQ